MALKTLYLVRHGHTVWHESGGIAGRTDIDLSDNGRAAVKQLATALGHNFHANQWFCSPSKRTKETCALLRQHRRDSVSYLPDIVLDERLVELDFGDWEGLTWSVVHERHELAMQQWGNDWVTQSPPNGESFSQQVVRCSEWLTDMQGNMHGDNDQSAIAICHGGSIRALMCRCLGWPLTRAMDFKVDPATLCELEFTGNGQWFVRRINALS